MKLNKYISAIGAGLLALGFTACQDDFKDPAFEAPVAQHKANMTILELKEMYWDDADNYIDTVGYVYNEVADDGTVEKFPTNADGTRKQLSEHIYISGRVISDDSDGNIFKSLVIQDETAAIAFSINQYDLYLQYRPGQEIVVDMTGMYLGKYNGLQQVGLPSWYEKGQVWNASFMPVEFFRMHAERNGMPEPEKTYTIEVEDFSSISTSPDGLRKWQSQRVKFDNVYFKNANGKTQFSSYKSSGVDQPIVDVQGNTMNVRTSGYSTFWQNPLPQGRGDVEAIMSYYGSSGWQLLLNNLEGCSNFGQPIDVVPEGSQANPYSVEKAISFITGDVDKTGWVQGYIVGAVAPEKTEVKSNDDVEWTAEPVLGNTLVIGATPETKDIKEALVISLPQGSPLREYGNLVDNPDNYQKEILVKGKFGMYMDTYGILNNNGTVDEFRIEGVNAGGGGSFGDGDGTDANPYNVAQVVAMNPTSTTVAVENGTGVWVTGYIVGYIPTGGSSTVLSGTEFSAEGAIASNLVLAPSAATKDYTQCIAVQLVSGSAVRKALNLMDHPEMLGVEVAIQGDVMKYCGGPGLRNTTDYKVIGDTPDTPDVPAGEAKGSGTATDPYNCAMANKICADGTYTDAEVYVAGTISNIKEIDTGSYGNATYFISDDGTTAGQFEIFRGYYLNGDKFTSADQIKVGDKVVVCGKLTNYNGTYEMTTGSKIVSINGEGGTTGGGETPDLPGEGSGTEEDPYSVGAIIALNPTSTQEAVATGVWAEGYIVGSIPTGGASTVISGTEFGTANAAASNLVLAPTADTKDYTKCIAVQLTSGSAVRSALNLKDNPGRLGAKVRVKGDVMKYCGAPGIKNTSAYNIDGETPDDPNPPTPPTGDPKGSGTVADPYNCAMANKICADGTYTDAEVYVAGTISNIKEVDTGTYGNATYFISDDGTTTGQFEIFRGYYFNGDKFTSADQIKVGDQVVVCGKLTNYNGTYEMTTGSKIYSLNGQTSTGGDEPNPNPDPTPDPNATTPDFDTFNGGAAVTNYGDYTTASGWKGTWIALLKNDSAEASFLGATNKLVPVIDGSAARQGKLTSPTLAGGIGTLTFTYGFPYNEKKAKFTVNILQGGSVVATDTVTIDPAAKGDKGTYTHEFNVSGDFVIEIVNDCLSQSSNNNADRVAIANMSWTH